MIRRIVGVITAGLIISGPAVAAAQTSRPRAVKPSIGLFGLFDYSSIASPKSYDAVFGKHATAAPGAGVEAIDIWKHFFVRIAGSQASIDGERVVIFNGDVFKLGIPLTVEMTPIEVGGGWRFPPKNPAARFAPYMGISAVMLKYKETSSFADAGDNVDEVFTGAAFFGGVDVRVARQVFGGIEAQYRSINAKPGPDSAAASFNEKNLGGTTFRVRLGVRF